MKKFATTHTTAPHTPATHFIIPPPVIDFGVCGRALVVQGLSAAYRLAADVIDAQAETELRGAVYVENSRRDTLVVFEAINDTDLPAIETLLRKIATKTP